MKRVDHVKASRAFIADEKHIQFHDKRLWVLRTLRDQAAHSIPEWEELRSLASGIKEHTLTLPVLLLLTDYFWHRGGIRKNAMLYGLLGVAAVVGGLYVGRILLAANTAGFGMRDLTPVQYLFTEGRVIWSIRWRASACSPR